MISMSLSTPRADTRLRPIELTIFAMLGALMYCSKVVMEWAPNIHLLGMFTMVYTLAYRKKALIPIYVYVFLNGFFAGFNAWWIPYLYIWTVLWGVTMLLPKQMPKKCKWLYIRWFVRCMASALVRSTRPRRRLCLG